jgi:hypothetical protein
MEFKKPMTMAIINDGPNTLRRKNTLRIPALIKPGSYLDEMNKKENNLSFQKPIYQTAGGYNHQT